MDFFGSEARTGVTVVFSKVRDVFFSCSECPKVANNRSISNRQMHCSIVVFNSSSGLDRT